MIALCFLFLTVPVLAVDNAMLMSWIKILEDCTVETKAEASAVENILFGGFVDDSRQGQCLLKCSFVNVGVMAEDGTFLQGKLMEFIKTAYDHVPTAILKDINEHCIGKYNATEDPCGKAYRYFTCVRGERESDAFNHTEKIVLDVQECNKDIQAPQDVVDVLISGKLDDSEKGMCLIQCIYQRWGLINKDGRRSAETEQVFKSMEFYDPSVTRMKKASDNCAENYNDGVGSCDKAYNYVKCIFDSEKTFVP